MSATPPASGSEKRRNGSGGAAGTAGGSPRKPTRARTPGAGGQFGMLAAQQRKQNRRLPPEVVRERSTILQALGCIVEMLGMMIGPHIEVVLHDLTRPESSILRIANGHVTGRKVGSPVLAGPRNDKGLAILSNALLMSEFDGHVPVFTYPTESRDGRALTSATVIFRDALGLAFASLCLNADFAEIEAAQAILARLLPRPPAAAEKTGEEAPDMEGLMHEIIEASVRRYGRPVSAMSKDEKTSAVETMLERGLFIVKGGVERAAAALGVTRFTVYNYLEAIRERRKIAAERETVPTAAGVARRRKAVAREAR